MDRRSLPAYPIEEHPVAEHGRITHTIDRLELVLALSAMVSVIEPDPGAGVQSINVRYPHMTAGTYDIDPYLKKLIGKDTRAELLPDVNPRNDHVVQQKVCAAAGRFDDSDIVIGMISNVGDLDRGGSGDRLRRRLPVERYGHPVDHAPFMPDADRRGGNPLQILAADKAEIPARIGLENTGRPRALSAKYLSGRRRLDRSAIRRRRTGEIVISARKKQRRPLRGPLHNGCNAFGIGLRHAAVVFDQRFDNILRIDAIHRNHLSRSETRETKRQENTGSERSE